MGCSEEGRSRAGDRRHQGAHGGRLDQGIYCKPMTRDRQGRGSSPGGTGRPMIQAPFGAGGAALNRRKIRSGPRLRQYLALLEFLAVTIIPALLTLACWFARTHALADAKTPLIGIE